MQIFAVQRCWEIHRSIMWGIWLQRHVGSVVRTFKNTNTFAIYNRFHFENLENILEDSWWAGCWQCENRHMRKKLAKNAQFSVVWAFASLVNWFHARRDTESTENRDPFEMRSGLRRWRSELNGLVTSIHSYSIRPTKLSTFHKLAQKGHERLAFSYFLGLRHKLSWDHLWATELPWRSTIWCLDLAGHALETTPWMLVSAESHLVEVVESPQLTWQLRLEGQQH